jgi:hypothetical protein
MKKDRVQRTSSKHSGRLDQQPPVVEWSSEQARMVTALMIKKSRHCPAQWSQSSKEEVTRQGGHLAQMEGSSSENTISEEVIRCNCQGSVLKIQKSRMPLPGSAPFVCSSPCRGRCRLSMLVLMVDGRVDVECRCRFQSSVHSLPSPIAHPASPNPLQLPLRW